jgi:mono/diheme cytochrome c family protein
MGHLPRSVVLAVLAAGCSEAGAPRAATVPLPPAVAPGLGVYVVRCEGCHGTDARGTPAGPSLLAPVPDFTWNATLLRSLREGVPPREGSTWTVRGMPPVPMAAVDEARLVAYLRWLAEGAAPADSIPNSPADAR